MVWEAWRSNFFVQMMVVAVMVVVVVVTQTGVVAAARLGGEAAKQQGKDAALELTTQVFNSSVWAAPATSVIVEFYAHWCPACQNFKPQYERVAQLFNGPDAVYPGVLLMAKVDCAQEINRNLCHRFSVKRYPTMLWGKPATFAWGGRLLEKDSNFEEIELRMNAQSLLDWINSRLKTSFSLDPAVHKKHSGEAAESVSLQMAVSIHDIEESTAEAYHIILDDKLVGSSQRAPFVQFLQLLAAYHPSRRCRAGSAQILFNLMDAWPSEHILEADGLVLEGGSLADLAALRQLHICGEDLPSKTYKTCNMVTGGYSCGLWYLFHAISVRVDDSESNGAMRAICNFVANFFTCEECRQHFLTMSQRSIDTVSSRRELTLWLWQAHNEVNHRLGKEGEVAAELESSKVQWPPKAVCLACRRSPDYSQGNTDEEIEWDEEEVYKFLRKTYGQAILKVGDEVQISGSNGDEAGHGKDDNVNNSAITAPVGAAVGIAMASCGFGVAACCWRLQQKKRKHMRKR